MCIPSIKARRFLGILFHINCDLSFHCTLIVLHKMFDNKKLLKFIRTMRKLEFAFFFFFYIRTQNRYLMLQYPKKWFLNRRILSSEKYFHTSSRILFSRIKSRRASFRSENKSSFLANDKKMFELWLSSKVKHNNFSWLLAWNLRNSRQTYIRKFRQFSTCDFPTMWNVKEATRSERCRLLRRVNISQSDKLCGNSTG